jgi:cAMP phosphodiesterase
MKIKVVGSYGGKSKNGTTSTFFIEDFLVIDAGNLFPIFDGKDFRFPIFLTHSHLDHIVDIPFILDILSSKNAEGISVYASKETITSLKNNIFNDTVWPDFTKILSKSGSPYLNFFEIKPYERIDLGKLKVMPIPVNHTVKTFGFVVESENSSIIISGDTKQTKNLWNFVESDEKIKGIFVDVSMPSTFQKLAEVSAHYTPATLLEDIRFLKREVKIFVYHVKPSFEKEVKLELKSKIPEAIIVYDGMEIEV